MQFIQVYNEYNRILFKKYFGMFKKLCLKLSNHKHKVEQVMTKAEIEKDDKNL